MECEGKVGNVHRQTTVSNMCQFSLPSGRETVEMKLERGEMEEGIEVMRSQCRELVTKEAYCKPY